MSAPDERPRGLEALAAQLGLPLRVLRRWVEHGLLPVLAMAEEPFAFRVLGTARALAALHRAGWSAERIAKALAAARTVVPDADQALAGLAAGLGEGRQVLRTPEGRLCEPSGQLRFDFGSNAASSGAPLPLRSPQDWFERGVDAELAGRLDEAVRAYQQALPGAGAEAHFNLGNCLYALRRRSEAALQFERAVVVLPDFAEAWNNLGIVRGELGERQLACAAFETALRLVPHYADAHYNLADLLADAGELEAARRHWRAYLAYDPNSRWADAVRRRLERGR